MTLKGPWESLTLPLAPWKRISRSLLNDAFPYRSELMQWIVRVGTVPESWSLDAKIIEEKNIFNWQVVYFCFLIPSRNVTAFLRHLSASPKSLGMRICRYCVPHAADIWKFFSQCSELYSWISCPTGKGPCWSPLLLKAPPQITWQLILDQVIYRIYQLWATGKTSSEVVGNFLTANTEAQN